jgi:hypothetical protein
MIKEILKVFAARLFFYLDDLFIFVPPGNFFNLCQFGFFSSRSVFFDQRRTKANCARKASKMEFAF